MGACGTVGEDVLCLVERGLVWSGVFIGVKTIVATVPQTTVL